MAKATKQASASTSPTTASAPQPAVGDTDTALFIGKGDQSAFLTLSLANRHGLVTGA
ncbi:MAG: ATPase, partial [Afipia sp.]|nr:ATPase [Afipia sp.]